MVRKSFIPINNLYSGKITSKIVHFGKLIEVHQVKLKSFGWGTYHYDSSDLGRCIMLLIDLENYEEFINGLGHNHSDYDRLFNEAKNHLIPLIRNKKINSFNI